MDISISPSREQAGIDQFKSAIKEYGWVHFRRMIDKEFLAELRSGLSAAYENCRRIQIKNGIGDNTNGTLHHLPGQHDVFVEFIKKLYLNDFIRSFFDAPYILNGFGGVINLPSTTSYVCNVHRDIRTFYNVPMMLNMLVMIDDFTLENGATWFLTGSNNVEERPDDTWFYDHADRAVGKAGDIILFDSLVWHAAGKNHSNFPRRALTLTFSRPFMKQQLDYPRLLGYEEGSRFSDDVRQVLGYNSRTPSSLDEWYQPAEKRYYRPGQG